MPRRSVTRFFIPLIDVLTLLFCIFLMMPVVKKSSEAEASDAARSDQLDVREARLVQRERDADARERACARSWTASAGRRPRKS